MGRDASDDGRAASRFGRQVGPGVPGSARSDAGRAQPCRYVPRSHVRDLLRLRRRRRPRSSAVRSAFKLACGRLPDTGRDLCSQPTLSRLENAPRLRDVIRLTYTLVDAWMDSYSCNLTRMHV